MQDRKAVEKKKEEDKAKEKQKEELSKQRQIEKVIFFYLSTQTLHYSRVMTNVQSMPSSQGVFLVCNTM